MEFKKSILILIMAIFLVSIAGVCASDVNDTMVASEDNLEIDQPTDDVIGVGEDTDLASNDENEVLSEGEQTFTQLNETINGNTDKDIYLNGNYNYSNGDDSFKKGIVIERDVNIYGNGAVIDGNKEARIFQINGGNVAFYNITFINGNAGDGWEDGGAINGNCKAINCTFKENHASHGGAMYHGSAVNCTFTGNNASLGGAMSYDSAVNCTFTGNNADFGGAMAGGSAVNCTFTGNNADFGGAMSYGSAVNCTFSENNAWSYGGAMYESNKINCTGQDSDYYNTIELVLQWDANNFTTIYGSGEKLPIKLKNQHDNPVTFINYDVIIYKAGSEFKTYHCLSNDDLSLDLLPGIYTAELIVTYPGLNKPESINITLTVTTDGTTFLDLNKTINDNTNDTITLDRNYTFNSAIDTAFTDGIIINRPVTINGNGFTINADGKARIFKVTSEGVVLNGIAFINGNISGNGGALNFNGNGTVTNCNFTDNNATSLGAAVYCYGICNVTGCTFINNNATSGNGGALRSMAANVGNCNFTDNSALHNGGALWIYSGTVTACNFIANKAITGSGGAVRFTEESYITNCNFTNNSANKAGAVIFTGKGNVKNCNFKNNRATSSEGGAVYLGLESNVANCNFTGNSARSGGAVYIYMPGNVTDCSFTGNNATNGGAIQTSTMCYGNVTGCEFTGNSAFNGGAVNMYTGIIENCNFTDNIAGNAGGAVVFSEGGSFAYCNFANNIAEDHGGAISMFTGNIQNCNFTGNNATTGSAINFGGFSGTNITNSSFLNNRANAIADNPFNVTVKGNTIEITFMGQDNLINAIYSEGDVNFTNVTYWGANGISNTGADSIILSPSDCEAGQNISVTGFVNGKILKTTGLTDDNGKIILENVSDYYLIIRHNRDSYYTKAKKAISNLNVNVTSQKTTSRTVNITAKSNIYNETMPGRLMFILANGLEINATYAAGGIWWAVHTLDDYADYQVNASYIGLSNVTISNATISITKAKTQITADAVTATYNVNRDLVITLKDITGKAVSGASITVDLNGAKTYTTDANGQVKVKTKSLVPKTYTAKITFNENENYAGTSAQAKVTVKKANPKILAKKKAFKAKTKVKKLTVTLKDNLGKPIKKAKLTIKFKKINKKKAKKKKSKTKKKKKTPTTAKTNSKGKATFKITKLTKKGKYYGVITYKGNNCYNNVVKKVKITIK